jgi:hypothetical protein
MSRVNFVPLARRITATATMVTVEDVDGRSRELHQFESVRATSSGLIVGEPVPDGMLRWSMRSWRTRIKRLREAAAARGKTF